MEAATAIVVRAVDWSETSAVVTLYTREAGKISALAKGARRPKGPFEAGLDLLSLCRIVFARKSSDVLDLLTESKLLRRFRPAGGELWCLYAGYYIAELLGSLTDEYEAQPSLFDLAEQTLGRLGGRRPPEKLLLPAFELAALEELGYRPSLMECVQCGKTPPSGPRVAFGAVDGGVLCPRCRPGKRGVVSLSQAALAALRRLAEDREAWAEMNLQRQTKVEIRGALNQYVAHLLGRKPRLHDYLTA